MKPLRSILLVEDDKDDQLFFLEALATIRNATLFDIAANGKEAVALLERSPLLPDMIFMDIDMPEMNGIECLARLMTIPRLENIPVVILSSATWEMDYARLIGAKAFIKKPSNADILFQQIEQMINLDFVLDSDIANQTFYIS